jgi:hypothetical protein
MLGAQQCGHFSPVVSTAVVNTAVVNTAVVNTAVVASECIVSIGTLPNTAGGEVNLLVVVCQSLRR